MGPSLAGTGGPRRRAVITGIGVVAPTGSGRDDHWRNTLAGTCAIGPITGFDASAYPVTLAGEVPGFVVEDHVDGRLIVQTDRWTWFGLAATEFALADAALDPATRDPYELSAVTASASGGNAFGQREIQALWASGPRAVSVHQSIGWFYAASTGQISIRHQLKGPCGVVVADAAGGLDALGQAYRILRRGGTIAVVGGTEAPVSPYALACQLSTGRMSTRRDPRTAYRPFDADANGYVPGEGGAMMVVEELATARHRGAPRMYAEIVGHASTFAALDHARPEPDGAGLARAMSQALHRAGVGAPDIDLVVADAAGDSELDAAEAAAIRHVFGERAGAVPVTAPKSMTGRLYAGGGALDVACAALAISTGRIPPTVNVDPASTGYGLDVVTATREAELNRVLVLARGHVGFNSAVVLQRVAGE